MVAHIDTADGAQRRQCGLLAVRPGISLEGARRHLSAAIRHTAGGPDPRRDGVGLRAEAIRADSHYFLDLKAATEIARAWIACDRAHTSRRQPAARHLV